MIILDWLLYEGSPFLPSVSPTSITKVIESINGRHTRPSFAIATEVATIGTLLNELHQKDFDWLVLQFDLNGVNLSHFMFGFTTPAALIMGANLLKTTSYKQTMHLICPGQPTPDMI
ncbi:MAG: hypothetical protein UW68_C0061G0003 [Candidatus Collierbacteria bacterium GW2011_GWB1_44_6]|uniref:Uncharacterized protein n=2 Tax=Candidatus Collieribacteriota TaxID=1752725 RepID=A0A0G1LRZ1_9BACT|nr:MAG: hypothetical protein UV68_C0066G0005 [Candidatus Collierbacteria bacterium GW2011_GWC2_43_12]KKT71597.1 MAG: hypothetical protein UW68_C0061G0003 [Candidatus Collierbacteria bacterium GW2011_GWB1_44_6]KKT81281.1 MAG: hypothetical protein UW80_C0054G0005 [Microgenomates group bacterium GW2011_GWC1_44_9]